MRNSINQKLSIELTILTQYLGKIACWALETEVLLSPKPGLVDQIDTGSHSDLTVELMLRSARVLYPYFVEMAEEGVKYNQAIKFIKHPMKTSIPSFYLESLRERIGFIGRSAEKAMLTETQGINTHKGAIWALGLLVTAAAIEISKNQSNDIGQLNISIHFFNKIKDICNTAGILARINDKYAPVIFSKGLYLKNKYKINGAREEAKSGFLNIVEGAFPMLWNSRQAGNNEEAAQIDALLTLMIRLSDTCVLSRSGASGLAFVQNTARSILEADKMMTKRKKKALIQFNKKMVAINASPGGSADLLAATLFVDAIVTDRFYI